MKLHGKSIPKAPVELVVIPREDCDLVFKLRPNTEDDYNKIEKLNPEPQPPIRTEPGKEPVEDRNTSEFIKRYSDWEERRFAGLFLYSLSETKDLEWETVDLSDVNTWKNYLTEFKSSGLVIAEVNALTMAFVKANTLDEKKLIEARTRFLVMQADQLRK